MIRATVDFTERLRAWDGFGFNYVETCQTADYSVDPQDYGGFDTLGEDKKQEILDLVFGDEGLCPSLVKMFLDPFHRRTETIGGTWKLDDADYDHETTTRQMRAFVREGLRRTRARGEELSILTTLYGPPAYMTVQKFLRGRDLDPAYRDELAKYYAAWVGYLIRREGFPVRYISLHNEGEDYARWPLDGGASWLDRGHDYNLYWPPEQVTNMIPRLAEALAANGLDEVKIGCGETTNWTRFAEWGYARALAKDARAMASLGLVTSHGFLVYNRNRWFADARSAGIDRLRRLKPALHAWTTSVSWKDMDVFFLRDFRDSIYAAKVNGVIPWAGIQCAGRWAKGDPNPGCAIRVDGKGGYTVEKGYYYYKQLCRAGRAGMSVCDVTCNDTELQLLGFTAQKESQRDAFVLLNLSQTEKEVTLNTDPGGTYTVYRTSENGERYRRLPDYQSGTPYRAAPLSAATFFRTEETI